jgi:hypothetical protein
MGMNRFHIHVDATRISPPDVHSLCAHLGFTETNFCGYPPGVVHYEPNVHLTWKGDDSGLFKQHFERTREFLRRLERGFSGYLEGEIIASDIDIEPRPFDPRAMLEVSLSLTSLPAGTFRESELHITACKDRSDTRLLHTLEQSGLFGAWLPKPYGTAVVYTVQGAREAVAALHARYRTFLQQAGGAVACSIKEERIARWWVSDPDVVLPPVVRSARKERSWAEPVAEHA